MKAYCFKCRRKVQMKDPEHVILRNGQAMIKGICSRCGIKVFHCDGNKGDNNAKS